MDTAVTVEMLLGPDHTEYGEVATRPVGPHAAIALSIGAHPKGYPAVDPNEDGVLAATDGTTTLLAVVDGHHGFDAAGAAMLAIHAAGPGAISGTRSESVLVDLVRAAVERVRDVVTAAAGQRRDSRTTLALALVRDSRLTLVGFGDSSAFVIGRRRVISRLPTTPFLGPTTDPRSIRPTSHRIEDGAVVVLGTDGLIDFLGADWKGVLRSAAEDATPVETAGRLVRAAGDGGAGDNVAVAVATNQRTPLPRRIGS